MPGTSCVGGPSTQGHEVTETGTTQRILPHAVVQNFLIGTGGELELATAGSTRPITSRVSHAGGRHHDGLRADRADDRVPGSANADCAVRHGDAVCALDLPIGVEPMLTRPLV
jgi:hypothetical protein